MHQQVKQVPFIKETVIHTGQHFSFDMSDVFFNELSIDIPVVNLGIHSLSHIATIGRTMEALEQEIKKLQPNFIIVFGDTNATLAGALTAKKMNIPVVHIEAGIRTFEEDMPEESNRYITDRIATINFCCTYLGMQHLEREGYKTKGKNANVFNSGDLMLDAFYRFSDQIIPDEETFEKLPIETNKYILATIHRKQNLEDVVALANIINALNKIHKELPVICPLHPNTKKVLTQKKIFCEFITLPPQGYLSMQKLLKRSTYVITDSGGLQREAFFAHKPSLILMEKPFWPEIIDHGCSLSCKSQEDEIIRHFEALKYLNKPFNISVFGSGQAAANIIDVLTKYFHSDEIRMPNSLKYN